MKSNVHHLIETLDAIVWEKDPATLEFIEINRPAEFIFGYPISRWLTEKNFIANHIHPEDTPRVFEFYHKLANSEKAQEIEYRIFDATGNIICLRDRVKAIKNQTGQIEKLAGFTVEISEIKQQIQTQTQPTQELFYTSLDNLLDGFAILRTIRNESGQIIDFKFEYINPAGCANSQLSQEQHIGKSLCELFPDHLTNGLFQEYCQVVETGQPLIKESLIYEAHNHQQHLSGAYDLRAAKSGDGIVVTWRNITERKPTDVPDVPAERLYQKLQRYQTELNQILDNVPVIIARLDKQLRYLYINTAITKATGLTPENFIGKTPQEISCCLPESYQQWVQKYQQALISKQPQRNELEWISSTGEINYFSCQIIPEIDQQGEVESLLGICYDITPLKKAQQTSTDVPPERLYEALLQQMPAGIMVALAPSGKLVLMNQQVKKIMHGEYPQAEKLEDYPTENLKAFYPDGQPYTIEQLPLVRAITTGEIIIDEEIELQLPDGNQITTLVSASPIRDQQGAIIAGVVSFYDISEQKRSQENLRLYSDLVKNVPVSLSVWQLENNNDPGSFRLKACNAAANQATKINLQNYIGTTIAESFPATLQTGLPEQYAEVVRTGIIKNIPEIYYPDQHPIAGYYSLKIFPLPNNSVGLAVENITERKQLEQALQKSEAKFRQLAEFMPLIVWCAKPDGAIDYINQRGSSYTGLNRENMEGWEWQTVVHPEDLPTTLKRWGHSIQTGQPYEIEFRLRQYSDGQYRWHIGRAEAIPDASGNIQGWFGSCTDIHDQKITTEKAQFRSEVSALLANSPNIETALQSLVNLALPTFADYCAIDQQQSDGSLCRIAASTNANLEQLLSQIQEHFPNQRSPRHRLSQVWQTGQPYLVSEITPEHLQECAADSEHLEILQQLGIKSLMSLPLIARERLLGAIHFASTTEGCRYNETDLTWALDIARRIAVAIDNAQLYQQTQEAERRKDESLALLNALLEGAPVGLAFFDKNLRFVRINNFLASLNGLPAELHIGRLLDDVMPAEQAEWIKTRMQQVLETGQPLLNLELSGPKVSNPEELVHMVVNYYPVCATNGEIMGVGCAIADISDLKHAEIALRQSQERFRRVFSSNMIGMGFWNVSGGIIEANDAFLDLIGYTREDLLSAKLSWQEITPPKYQLLDREGIEECLEKGICTPYEKEYICKDGSLVPILSGAALFENSQESGVFFVLDLSERKKAEQALRESETRFRTMADNSPAFIWMADLDGHCTYFNRPWLEFNGYATLEESLQKGWLDRMHPADIPRCMELYWKAFNARESVEMEYRQKRADGQYRWIFDTGVPLYAPDGSFSGYIGSGIDITERREAEERLYETNLTLNRLIQSCPLAITVFDMETGIVKMWNPAAERIFGWSASEAIGQFLPSVSQEKLKEFLENLEVIKKEGEVAAQEAKRLHKSGKVVDVAIWGARLVDANHNMSCLSIIADITEGKRLEAERNQLLIREQAAREQAEKANRVKDEFLAVLSHELRSPLNAILGWAQMLRSRKCNEAMTSKALETIERNARLQSQLIEDLLDVSRILRGKVSLSVTPVNVASVIEAAVDTVRLSAAAKSIEIDRFIEPNVGLVAGDAGRLQQVFWNLLSNAIKFTPDGGRMEIRVSKVRINGNQTNEGQDVALVVPKFRLPMTNFAQIQVIDTGKGISVEFLPFVFEYFRQADSSSTRAHGGLGLGLAIVRHLVELHGGTVKADSKGEGEGSTFTVWLPLLPTKKSGTFSEELRDENTSPSGALLTGLQVLVLDDDTDSRDYITAVLEEAGAVVQTAADVDAAIISLCRVKPDVLVSDIGMPGQDGYTFIRRVRALEAGWRGNIPAVALTAYATDDDRRRALEAGFQQHLAKPVQPDELVRVVAGLSGRSGDL
ncbi:PAS domain S-box protein [Ancylothrix sp. C2]|uniref:PAS domain S-box protein n=1 Tax=Ancylothrix sp. D3o TaxID=2953691 RepID=UPI0021BBA317|nr:PAS domain S-box protein [Ancylothrix sp. D3o]MCT7951181.1 PAS domain S-box protein [Ancylothrix sp. D3o]